ncbi:MAG: phosphate transport system permease protein [Methanosarcinales archaeon]|nr:MAG: Phosphate ABC transporter, inner membrane subunit PstA [Euryarchaeota archaeon 55_53]KUK30361.1 MAG: Phosphate ABC transporter, inner membrane subunit PstA [Methanosarcinales archeaon 56_1174]MDI3487548.1 phosphate transport system permease protein [Methanosarcinales archaeon]MDN5294697.1 phosphate transport system permease protein [Methanosarcinales archaeon]
MLIRQLKERLFIATIVILAFLVVFPLFHIIYSVAIEGLPVVIKGGWGFVTGTLAPPGGGLGGIGPAIVGTFVLTFLASLMGLPMAIITGIYAAEYPNSLLGRLTRLLLMVMMEFPTILVGLFVMQLVVIPVGSYSAIAGALALVIVLMPYVAVYTEEALKEIPPTYREAAFSLGLTRFKVVFRVLVGMARKGILTGILIGMAKVAGETAPLLFTAGGSSRIYFAGVDKPIGAIPLLIYDLIQQPYENYHEIAWGASFLLLMIFLAIFLPIRLSFKEVKL